MKNMDGLRSAAGSTAGPDASDESVAVDVELVCPACGGKLIRRSMRRGLFDHLKSMVGLWPYRCVLCNTRFNGPQDAESIARHESEAAEVLSEEATEAKAAAEEADADGNRKQTGA